MLLIGDCHHLFLHQQRNFDCISPSVVLTTLRHTARLQGTRSPKGILDLTNQGGICPPLRVRARDPGSEKPGADVELSG